MLVILSLVCQLYADALHVNPVLAFLAREGVLNFSSSFMSPGYSGLMTTTDRLGKNWSFLATRENYDRVRAMQTTLCPRSRNSWATSKAISGSSSMINAVVAVCSAI